MEIIRHRVNSASELRSLPLAWGAECDVRSRGGRLILAHDPHAPGEPLDDYLRVFRRSRRSGRLILNPKEDGLELELLAKLRRLSIRRYFILDLPVPSMVRLAAKDKGAQLAARVSEFEPPSGALSLSRIARWVWLDCFSGRPPSRALAQRLKSRLRVCLVSPELEGHAPDRIKAFRPLSSAVDAVCTRHPERWLS